MLTGAQLLRIPQAAQCREGDLVMTSRRVTLSDHLALVAKPVDDKEYQIHDRLLAGLMLQVQPSGAKNWVFRQRVNGRPERVTLSPGETKPVVEACAKAYAYLDADTTFEASSKPKGPTFADMAGIYMDCRAVQWNPSAHYTLECYLNSTLLPFFADMPIDKITRADVTRWFHEYGRTRPGGANRAVDMLRDLFHRHASSTERYAHLDGRFLLDAAERIGQEIML